MRDIKYSNDSDITEHLLQYTCMDTCDIEVDEPNIDVHDGISQDGVENVPVPNEDDGSNDNT